MSVQSPRWPRRERISVGQSKRAHRMPPCYANFPYRLDRPVVSQLRSGRNIAGTWQNHTRVQPVLYPENSDSGSGSCSSLECPSLVEESPLKLRGWEGEDDEQDGSSDEDHGVHYVQYTDTPSRSDEA